MSGHRLIRNAIRCRLCGDIIESRDLLDLQRCMCGNAVVVGGCIDPHSTAETDWDSIETLYEYTG